MSDIETSTRYYLWYNNSHYYGGPRIFITKYPPDIYVLHWVLLGIFWE